MKFDEFVGHVQKRTKLPTLSDTMGAVRATLETLGERVSEDDAKELASQLPREIGYFLFRGAISLSSKRFGYREFIERVGRRECVSNARAAFHARVVMDVVSEAVADGEMEDVVSQLPPEFEPLFAGSAEAPAEADDVREEDETAEAEPEDPRFQEAARRERKGGGSREARSKRQLSRE